MNDPYAAPSVRIPGKIHYDCCDITAAEQRGWDAAMEHGATMLAKWSANIEMQVASGRERSGNLPAFERGDIEAKTLRSAAHYLRAGAKEVRA